MSQGSARPRASNPDSQTGLQRLDAQPLGDIPYRVSSTKDATNQTALGPVSLSTGSGHNANGKPEATESEEVEEIDKLIERVELFEKAAHWRGVRRQRPESRGRVDADARTHRSA